MAGGSGAPAVAVGGLAGIGPSNPSATRMTALASGSTIRDRPSASTQMTSDNGDAAERTPLYQPK